MPAAIDLIARAMRRAGVLATGETPTASETMDALAALNGLLEQWSIDGLTVYARHDITFTATGAASYSIGPTGDVVDIRPDMVFTAFSRLGDSDAPIDQAGDGEFTRIFNKSACGRPAKFRYRPSLPDARIDLWPIPGSEYEIHLTVGKPFTRADSPADEIDLAPGYDRALFLTLAVELCSEFQRPIPDGLPQIMTDAIASVRRKNINDQPDIAVFDTALACGAGRNNFTSG